MKRIIRQTEVIAQETLFGAGESDPGLLNQLLILCSGQPTAAELQDALCLMTPIAATLRAWISSQKLIQAKAEGTAAFQQLHLKARQANGELDTSIAADYPVGRSTIAGIRLGKSWKSI